MSELSIVGVGARTAVGLNALQTGFLLRAGFPAMTESPLADAAGEPVTMAFVPTLDGRLTGAKRLLALARHPFIEAMEAVRGMPAEVMIGIDEGLACEADARLGLAALAEELLPGAKVTVSARGETGLVAALPAAVRALELRQADAVILGGVHSDHDPGQIASLESRGHLFSRENLDSRIPGEAAAFVVLMRAVEASGKKVARLCDVRGHGLAREEVRGAASAQGETGEPPAMAATALSSAIRAATEGLRREGAAAGWLWTDLTTETRRIHEWGAAFVRAQDVLARPYFVDSPAQRIGYLGAAALPLFAATACVAWRHGYAVSETALGIAGTDSGERAALLLGRAGG
ncbi:MAG: beta-ketoacyl synthase N-terminal-like domain-containing protein [Polyangiaceae bacterium]